MSNGNPQSGGPYTLYCDKCGCWISNTTNAEMRKEGVSSRKETQKTAAVRKHTGKPVPICCIRANIKPGMEVDIVLKKDQTTGILTRGVVTSILTNSHTHPRGIKVMLTDGSVGRVQELPAKE